MRAIIIDDEEACRTSLQTQLEWSCPEVEVVTMCSNISDGKNAISRYKPDILFLDIEMPGGTGFDLLRSMPKIDFDVVFTTAYDEYALEAFQVFAQAYLLKPIDGDDLVKAIRKLQELQQRKSNDLEWLLANLNNNAANQKLAFPVSDGLRFVNKEDIVRCESDSSYCHIHFVDGSSLFISKTLKQVAFMINDDRFKRVHHSHLINLEHIAKYVKGSGGHVILLDGSSIPVSRNKKDDFLGQF